MEVEDAFNYRSRVFVVLWIVNFLLTFAISLVATPIPYLMREFVVGQDVQSAITEAYGIVLSLGYVATTLGYFLGGFMADSVGRRTIVASSFFMLAAGFGLFAVASNMYFLYAARFIQMFGLGFSAPALSALVADYSEQGSRGMAYGVYNLSWITAQIPAPLLGGMIAQFVNLRIPFVMAIFISVMGLLFSIPMRGKHVEKSRVGDEEAVVVEVDSKKKVSIRKIVLIFSLTNLMNGLLNGFVGPVFNGFLMFRLNAEPTEYGLVSAIAIGVVTAIVQIPGGKLTDKFGRKHLVIFSFLGAPLVFALAFSQSLLEFGLILGAIAAVGNISGPATSAWLMDFVPKHKRASVSGITRTLNGAGLSMGPTAGSYVWNMTKPDAVVPCFVASLIYAIGLPFYLILGESRKTSEAVEAN
ncbi:MAG: MFS transporter [Candidatus Bathyarchaeota archaeon]|nr:MFS transporter [Candidatus Bathyarchaeota archaeon]MDH5786886.1 MFS transporter [Candidatus Bathyarchaeota archaeon]